MEDELLADENITPIERVYGYRENDALINRYITIPYSINTKSRSLCVDCYWQKNCQMRWERLA